MHANIEARVCDLATGEVRTLRTHNTVCEGWHKLLIRLATPEDALDHTDLSWKLAVGDDDTTTPAYSNTSLNNEVARTDVTDWINEGTNLFTSTFIDSTEANASGGGTQSIVEVGVVVEVDGESTEYLCNHSTIAEIQKDNTKTATIESTLELNNDTGDS